MLVKNATSWLALPFWGGMGEAVRHNDFPTMWAKGNMCWLTSGQVGVDLAVKKYQT